MLALLVSWLLALPFTTPKYEVTVERNVPYATAPGYYSHTPVGERKAIVKLLFHSGWMSPITLEMDIYLPEGDLQEPRPLLLMMHGGAFFIGNKEELGQAAWCRYFASLGYVAASINYRLGFHPVKAEVREAEMRALEDTILPYEEGYPLNNGLKHISDYFYGTHAIHEKAVSLGIPAEHHPAPNPGMPCIWMRTFHSRPALQKSGTPWLLFLQLLVAQSDRKIYLVLEGLKNND